MKKIANVFGKRVNLNNPDLWVVNIPFLNPQDARKVANDLTEKEFELIRVEQIDGQTYARRHDED